jgi:prepilin-type N-terminal cleavage/methylation domain-containing protein
MKAKNGFTSVEIMIVVVILGILAAIVIPQFARVDEKARQDAEMKNSLVYKYKGFVFLARFSKTKAVPFCGCERHLIVEDPVAADSDDYPMGVFVCACDFRLGGPNDVEFQAMNWRYVPYDHPLLELVSLEKMKEIGELVREDEARRGKEEGVKVDVNAAD